VTNQPVDLLIVGEASLGVINEDSKVEYTKDGSFVINRNGDIVDSFGRKLYPGFKIPKNTQSVNIDFEGQVDIYLKGQKKPVRIGQVAIFKNEDNDTYINITGSDHQIEIHQGKLYVK
jgi:flagellar basal-body rod protein FlgG